MRAFDTSRPTASGLKMPLSCTRFAERSSAAYSTGVPSAWKKLAASGARYGCFFLFRIDSGMSPPIARLRMNFSSSTFIFKRGGSEAANCTTR